MAGMERGRGSSLTEAGLKEVLKGSEERQQHIRARLQEIREETAEAETNRMKIQDLEQQLAYTETQLASTNFQHEVMRTTLQANRAADPLTANLRGELRIITQRNAKLKAQRDSLAKQLQDSEQKYQDLGSTEPESNVKEPPQSPLIQSAGPKKEQLADVAKEAADLELETEKLKQTFARAEDEQSFHLAKKNEYQKQLADSDQKLQEALKLQQEESSARVKQLQDLLLAKKEEINAVQNDTDQLLLELQQLQKQYDLNEAEIKELSSSFERSQRKEKQNKKVAVRLQSELEDLSQKLSIMQQRCQHLEKDADRYRWKTLVMTVGIITGTLATAVRVLL